MIVVWIVAAVWVGFATLFVLALCLTAKRASARDFQSLPVETVNCGSNLSCGKTNAGTTDIPTTTDTEKITHPRPVVI
jgi:hypothetical protein